MSKIKPTLIKVYVSPETKQKVIEKYGDRCVSYGLNKLIQKNLKKKK